MAEEGKHDVIAAELDRVYSKSTIIQQNLHRGSPFRTERRKREFTQLLFGMYLCIGSETFSSLIGKMSLSRLEYEGVEDPLGWEDYLKAKGSISVKGSYMYISVPSSGILNSQIINSELVKIVDNKSYYNELRKFKALMIEASKPTN
ncbi:hypothetical protein [Rubritalea tangerina]|uniref:Transposase n=1 Tax=Rubritalea tangerina TaxID=430798 RepID=A0ABW4ZCF3_9BACT